MPSPSESAPPPKTTLMDSRAEVPSFVAWTTTVPVWIAVTRPSAVTVAIKGLLIVYCVPLAEAVTSAAVPSENAAEAFNCVVAPTEVSVVMGVFRIRPVGMGVVAPSRIGGTLTEPFVGRRKRSDCPERVRLLSTQVARARTCPKFAGMLGRTHVPSGLTCTLRFSTLTTQFSFNCPHAGSTAMAQKNESTTEARLAAQNCDHFRCMNVPSLPDQGWSLPETAFNIRVHCDLILMFSPCFLSPPGSRAAVTGKAQRRCDGAAYLLTGNQIVQRKRSHRVEQNKSSAGCPLNPIAARNRI